MPNSHIPRTNEKLAFARLQLQQAVQLDRDSGHNAARLLLDSYIESVTFHLLGAVNSFLREIAETYKVKGKEINSLADLQNVLQDMGRESSELKELQGLMRPDQWLWQLQTAYQGFASATQPVVEAAKSSEKDELLIQAVQVNTDKLDFTKLTAWQSALQELINRHRETMLEW